MRIQKIFTVVGLFGVTLASLGLFLLAGPASSPNVEGTSGRLPVAQEGPADAAQVVELSQNQAKPACSRDESALRSKVELLKRGRAFVSGLAGYTGKLRKQEVVHGELLGEQEIFLKCRHKPFSVYLNWLAGDVGREVIYIEGQNDGKIIAHDGGWKARIPAFVLAPDHMLAMRDARYPVTTAGVVNLIDVMLGVHDADLQRSDYTCKVEDAEFEHRPCRVFTTEYQSAEGSPIYRKSVTSIDKEWNVPIHTEHFEWPRRGADQTQEGLDRATLIEAYTFADLQVAEDLSDRDFDRKNPEYKFR